MMKKASVVSVLCVILCAVLFCISGCAEYYAQPGETAAEGHRRHLRNLSINNQNLMYDIDKALLIDEPSKATDIRID